MFIKSWFKSAIVHLLKNLIQTIDFEICIMQNPIGILKSFFII